MDNVEASWPGWLSDIHDNVVLPAGAAVGPLLGLDLQCHGSADRSKVGARRG